jgi:hypothetical protein
MPSSKEVLVGVVVTETAIPPDWKVVDGRVNEEEAAFESRLRDGF